MTPVVGPSDESDMIESIVEMVLEAGRHHAVLLLSPVLLLPLVLLHSLVPGCGAVVDLKGQADQLLGS